MEPVNKENEQADLLASDDEKSDGEKGLKALDSYSNASSDNEPPYQPASPVPYKRYRFLDDLPNAVAFEPSLDVQRIRLRVLEKHGFFDRRDKTGQKRKIRLEHDEELRNLLMSNNEFYRQKQLEMMEVQHTYNVKLANLKIKKMELEIAYLQRNCLPKPEK